MIPILQYQQSTVQTVLFFSSIFHLPLFWKLTYSRASSYRNKLCLRDVKNMPQNDITRRNVQPGCWLLKLRFITESIPDLKASWFKGHTADGIAVSQHLQGQGTTYQYLNNGLYYQPSTSSISNIRSSNINPTNSANPAKFRQVPQYPTNFRQIPLNSANYRVQE